MPKTLTVLLSLLLSVTPAVAEPTHVVVVRHAERAPEPPDDPALSLAGLARAELLAQMLASAQVRTIITTQLQRTQATAAPLARQQGITPTVLPIRRGGVAAHIAEVVAEVRKASGVVLVVGHSNTVAGIVAGLSGSTPAPLCETSFSHFFVTTPAAAGSPAVQLRYGQADVPPEAGCQ